MASRPPLPEIIPIRSDPGVKRDGTQFDGNNYVDAKWCRFQNGLPRKMLGYRSINKYLEGLGRTIHEYTQNSLTYIHVGSANRVERFHIDGSFNTSIITDRTPLSGFTTDDDNLWQFDIDHCIVGGLVVPVLVAQVAPNLDCLCNTVGGELFYGTLTGTDPLVPITTLPSTANASGGIVALHPYTVAFGTNGYIMWSMPDDPTDFTGSGAGYASITGQKLIRALPLRSGSGNSPGGLLWSADSLIHMSYVGGTAVFDFDTLSAESSIMSAQSVVEYDGVFYWVGSDRFLMFNGVVREVPNMLNRDYFFDNLNYTYRQKVFAFKVPRFGEIWWCYPSGDSTEANEAVIFNVRENTWYDTALPDGGRGAAIFPSIFRRPLMTGVDEQPYVIDEATVATAGTGYVVGDILTLDGGTASVPVEITVTTLGGGGSITGFEVSNTGNYSVTPTNNVATTTTGVGVGATFTATWVQPYKFWVHETGYDAIDGTDLDPIESYFETADVSLPVIAQANNQIQVLAIEPDFVQREEMTVEVKGRMNARAPTVTGDPVTFADTAATYEEQLVYLKTQRRQLRFRFTSNILGGYYEMGNPLAHVKPGDGTTRG